MCLKFHGGFSVVKWNDPIFRK